jgi:hypothetical protein
MNIDTVYDLFQNLHNDNLSFIYQGSFNDEITERIIDISESNISGKQQQIKIGNKVSFLLAECFQNVIRHGENISFKKFTVESSGIFITRNIGKSYYISSANLIDNRDVESLKLKLEQINQLNPEELKRLYLNNLESSDFSKRGGAGLGLIEMARRSGQKLEFDFETVDNEVSFFYLQIKLQNPDEIDSNESINVNVAKDFHHTMTIDNIFIIHKGDFSQHTIVPILRMIEDNLNNQVEKNASKKKIFHALVEILQNVSKHAYEKDNIREGIFMIGKMGEKFLVYTGNYIQNSNVQTLKEYIGNLNGMTKNELVELYKMNLHMGTTTSGDGPGLGLVDIARDSEGGLDFSFIPVDDNLSFYALGVKI